MGRRRMPRELWLRRRREVWERDKGFCQGPYCVGAPPLALTEAHIDHIRPRTRGGPRRDEQENLRVLCRRCHCLRADNAHRGMIAAALRDGIIPADWRPLVWEG